MENSVIDGILFDFGGVLASEGFKNGLFAIASANGQDPTVFQTIAESLVFTTGYLTGHADESTYWQALREHTGIVGSDQELKGMILESYTLRTWMLDLIKNLKGRVKLAILSDQTNWLDELEARYRFFRFFDYVFNSYHLGKSKLDPAVFDDVLARMDIQPSKALFVDDRIDNIERAQSRGLHTLHYTEKEVFQEQLAHILAI